MTFIWVGMLWMLVLVPLLVAAYFLIQRRRHKYALRYASLSMIKEAMGRGPGIRRHIPSILFLVGITVMLVALARPAATITLPSQEGTVILALDVSRSMMADDMKPNRLEAAKAAARAFVEKQPKNVRIGVVSFSNTASIVQAPATDREAVLSAINRLTPQMGTAIGFGILTSLDAIFEVAGGQPAPATGDVLGSQGPTPALTAVPRGTFSSAVIILLSDGQSNTGPAPLDVVDQAGNRGIRIYTVGVGSSAGTILRFQGRSMRVLLDEETLKHIAEETDGQYFRADNESDLQKIYNTLGTQVVFKTEQTELTAWFTGFAILTLLIAAAFSLMWFNRLP